MEKWQHPTIIFVRNRGKYSSWYKDVKSEKLAVVTYSFLQSLNKGEQTKK